MLQPWSAPFSATSQSINPWTAIWGCLAKVFGECRAPRLFALVACHLRLDLGARFLCAVVWCEQVEEYPFASRAAFFSTVRRTRAFMGVSMAVPQTSRVALGRVAIPRAE